MIFLIGVARLEGLAGDIEHSVMNPILLLYYTACNLENIDDHAHTTPMNMTYILEKALSCIPLK